jgi:hypothetical protein
MTGPHGALPTNHLKQSVASLEDARMRERRLALLIAALAVSASTHGHPAVRADSQKRVDPEVSWLSPSEHELLRRSYLRCLRAQYARMGHAQLETLLDAAFDRDLDPFTLLISQEDVKLAPRLLVSGVPHIRCEWFNDGSATAR